MIEAGADPLGTNNQTRKFYETVKIMFNLKCTQQIVSHASVLQ